MLAFRIVLSLGWIGGGLRRRDQTSIRYRARWPDRHIEVHMPLMPICPHAPRGSATGEQLQMESHHRCGVFGSLAPHQVILVSECGLSTEASADHRAGVGHIGPTRVPTNSVFFLPPPPSPRPRPPPPARAGGDGRSRGPGDAARGDVQ